MLGDNWRTSEEQLSWWGDGALHSRTARWVYTTQNVALRSIDNWGRFTLLIMASPLLPTCLPSLPYRESSVHVMYGAYNKHSVNTTNRVNSAPRNISVSVRRCGLMGGPPLRGTFSCWETSKRNGRYDAETISPIKEKYRVTLYSNSSEKLWD